MVDVALGDGTTIDVVVEGAGPALLLSVDPVPAEGARADELRKWGVDPALGRSLIDGFSDRFRVVAFDYEGHLAAHPKPETLTPATIADDILTIADAVDASNFAWYGYSWLALSGLQLALRTHRLTALVMGGFPPIDGPYDAMLAVTAATHEEARKAADAPDAADRDAASAASAATGTEKTDTHATAWGDDADWDPADYDWSTDELTLTEPQTRQYLTLYRALEGFDDRAAQTGLTVPRLCFAGSADTIEYGERWGGVTVDIAGPLVRERDELERLGWQVRVLESLTHISAMQPEAVLPVIRQWLIENLH